MRKLHRDQAQPDREARLNAAQRETDKIAARADRVLTPLLGGHGVGEDHLSHLFSEGRRRRDA